MTRVTEIVAPLLNVNEPDALVVAVTVREGDRVEMGGVICALETTKAAAEVTSPVAGFVRHLRVRPGVTIAPDERICVVTPTPDEAVEGRAPVAGGADDGAPDEVPEGLRITRAARALARELGVALAALPRGPIVTARDIRAHAAPTGAGPLPGRDRSSGAAQTRAGDGALPSGQLGAGVETADNRIIVFGGGGHGRSLLDLLARDPAVRVAGVVDDALAPGQTIHGSPVLGPAATLVGLAAEGIRLAANGVGGLRRVSDRIDAFRTLAAAGFFCPALVHAAATVEGSATIHDGAQVFANAYVGSDCVVGRGAIVNTGAAVSHDCALGEWAHVAPGATLAGAVRVGARTLIGMGVVVAVGVRIGTDARIGNGAIINADVADRTIVPAGSVWPRRTAGDQDHPG